ncbi:FERM and PDZ domain-containing protein 2 [Coregonus clupeaformis]|uniref:FERM and PDZ domain-containing protein 2 n=1 Tax=Coregonus clupeaformis TaxID=59861 RepID=UPI001BE0A1D2|nr:FERM and PDZ domain-containing protein 2 [Coregonus clupeaformis]
MVFHRVGREKKPMVGELVLGVCATGIIVYELKNHLRTVTQRFLWRETDTISANALGPEFIRMADEPCVVLELPGSIVSKKGRSCSSQREVSVVLPSGQSVLVKCDIKSRGRDMFDMVVAHANLVEHFYFGLAFIDDENVEKDQSICRTCDSHKKRRSCSEVVLNSVEIPPNLGQRESLSMSCDEITAKVEARLQQQRELREINRDLSEPCPLSEMKEQAWR